MNPMPSQLSCIPNNPFFAGFERIKQLVNTNPLTLCIGRIAVVANADSKGDLLLKQPTQPLIANKLSIC